MALVLLGGLPHHSRVWSWIKVWPWNAYFAFFERIANISRKNICLIVSKQAVSTVNFSEVPKPDAAVLTDCSKRIYFYWVEIKVQKRLRRMLKIIILSLFGSPQINYFKSLAVWICDNICIMWISFHRFTLRNKLIIGWSAFYYIFEFTLNTVPHKYWLRITGEQGAWLGI